MITLDSVELGVVMGLLLLQQGSSSEEVALKSSLLLAECFTRLPLSRRDMYDYPK